VDKKLQLRSQRFADAQFRAEEKEGKRYIRGYPIVFNVAGHPYRGSEWTETVDPAALADVDLSGLRLLVGHDTRQVLGRSGVNLRAEVDAVGLFIEAELPDTTLARDIWELVQRQILDGMSFSFYADRWETDVDKKQERILHITDLPEVSIVTFPAYDATVAMATERKQHDPATARALAEAELNFYLSTF
jgi:HK97 family phage prohead protease